jgi:YbbR domain-containing protein
MSALTRHWELKVLALGFAVVLWLFVMTSEKSDRILSAPVEFDGVPAGLMLIGERPDSVNVQLHALRTSLSRLGADQIKARVDLSGAGPGDVLLRVLPEQVEVPAGITVVRVNPSRIHVVLEAVAASRSQGPPPEP